MPLAILVTPSFARTVKSGMQKTKPSWKRQSKLSPALHLVTLGVHDAVDAKVQVGLSIWNISFSLAISYSRLVLGVLMANVLFTRRG